MAQEEYRKYIYIGGMPQAVKNYVEEKSLANVRAVQEQIIQTYIADFPKYNSKINFDRAQRIFAATITQLGKKLIYQRFDAESKSREIRKVIELLIDARVIIPCTHTNGNTIPLAGESDTTVQKLYFLDVGLSNSLMKLDFEAINNEFEHNFNTKLISGKLLNLSIWAVEALFESVSKFRK